MPMTVGQVKGKACEGIVIVLILSVAIVLFILVLTWAPNKLVHIDL